MTRLNLESIAFLRTSMGVLPSDGFVRDIAVWQLEDTFQLLGVQLTSDGKKDRVFEFDTALSQFILIQQVSVCTQYICTVHQKSKLNQM